MTRSKKKAIIRALNLTGAVMKSQKQNVGELKDLTVKIEKKVAEDFELMAKNSGINIDELVVIALKRFRSSHLDYLKATLTVD